MMYLSGLELPSLPEPMSGYVSASSGKAKNVSALYGEKDQVKHKIHVRSKPNLDRETLLQ